ncbi:MAG: 4Fe-4S binding protein, partial [Dehalococcoidia bacterium]|nr:4Fe-4S binding protein [Dehalococcoidia bacterium]
CIGCGLCVADCGPQILEVAGGIARLIEPLSDLCDRAGVCAEVCPVGAIRVKCAESEVADSVR